MEGRNDFRRAHRGRNRTHPRRPHVRSHSVWFRNSPPSSPPTPSPSLVCDDVRRYVRDDEHVFRHDACAAPRTDSRSYPNGCEPICALPCRPYAPSYRPGALLHPFRLPYFLLGLLVPPIQAVLGDDVSEIPEVSRLLLLCFLDIRHELFPLLLSFLVGLDPLTNEARAGIALLRVVFG